jgi:hypothetical protein
MLAQAFALPMVPSLLLAALAMATSPAAVLRVANELQSSGQVTERLFHLTACNCVLSLFVFKAIVGYWVLASAGSASEAVWNSLVVIGVSVSIGAAFGVAVPALLRQLGNIDRNATVAFAAATLLLTAVTHAFKFSPLLAALAFGLVARHRRVDSLAGAAQLRHPGRPADRAVVRLCRRPRLTGSQVRSRTSRWHWPSWHAASGWSKTLATTTVFARPSGVSWRKGALTGLAMMPMSGLRHPVARADATPASSTLLDQVAGLMQRSSCCSRSLARCLRAGRWSGPAKRISQRRAAEACPSERVQGQRMALSMGVELELQLVNSDRLRPLFLGQRPAPPARRTIRFPGDVKPEITESMLEISTAVHHPPRRAAWRSCAHIRDALGPRRRPPQRRPSAAVARTLSSAGSERRIFRQAALQSSYRSLYGYLAKQFTVFGQHIHIGCTSSANEASLPAAFIEPLRAALHRTVGVFALSSRGSTPSSTRHG